METAYNYKKNTIKSPTKKEARDFVKNLKPEEKQYTVKTFSWHAPTHGWDKVAYFDTNVKFHWLCWLGIHSYKTIDNSINEKTICERCNKLK